ncbi:MAG: M14 family zinc carboxypeptidase [Pseudobdellovibrionaceae bacterium]
MLLEIQQVEKIINELGPLVRSEVLAYSQKGNLKLPIHKLSFGSEDPEAPVVGLVGGVHGLERIGSQVCISLLHSFSELLLWDEFVKESLKHLRVFFIPIVNPIGILTKTRSNPRGVDLMRNAPIEGENPPRFLGGHRYSPLLPWYRGVEGSPMEVESLALVQAVQREIFRSSLAITIDFHSGFGVQDQIWFPYAKTAQIYPGIGVAHAFKSLFDRTFPHHFYKIEPQALNYTTHGDLWDYLYDQYAEKGPAKGVYLPLCIEMGSWMWVKKNPLQLLNLQGHYNPMKSHRVKRTLRRHNTFFEFTLRAALSPQSWAFLSEEQRLKHEALARELWYA